MRRSRAFFFVVALLAATSVFSVSAPLSQASAFVRGDRTALRAMPSRLGQPVHVPPQFRAALPGVTVPGTIAPDPSGSPAPSFDTFQPPAGIAVDAGEPSIGVNWNTGNIMFQAYTETDRVTIDDTVSPPVATWSDVTAPNAVISMDPISFTDPVSGRTAVSQLITAAAAGAPAPFAGCSLSMVTADDGENWDASTGCGLPGSADHQTIGGGPYADPTSHPQASEDRAMYYCAQNLLMANCALSTDGGLTYGAAVPTYTLFAETPQASGACRGLHGHIKVGPDGTAYLPNFGCTEGNKDYQSVVVSEDDGLTWEARIVPDALYNDFKSDPSVGIATDGNTLYFAYEPATGPPQVAVSHDKGLTWTNSAPLGADLNVAYGVFPAVVAGDPDRAAVAYIGTPNATNLANDYENSAYAGVWHLYVSMTYDGGQTWKTIDTTPTDPVQRGCIWWGNAGGCPGAKRNLLDFMDATIDQFGRVVVGYADGCVGTCVSGSGKSEEDIGAIARQGSGLSLYSEFDSMFTPAQ
jgi:hypothetical protein